MPTLASSSPVPNAFKTARDELEYYKAQYEHLATELHDFQETSHELEAELEREAEAAELRERNYKAKIEALGYEIEEWKTKYAITKKDGNAAQAELHGEITTLRDANRTQQLKLRDMEVSNDDFERQARNTTSTLEDMSAKYDSALERSVLLEEEVRMAEQEREGLRIGMQRLRDELSDLRVEADIFKDKLRLAETAKLSTNTDTSTPDCTGSHPPALAMRSPTTCATGSRTQDGARRPVPRDITSPPSPPLSETSGATNTTGSTSTILSRPPKVAANTSVGSQTRYRYAEQPTERTARIPLISHVPEFARSNSPRKSQASSSAKQTLPRSGSLHQLKGLRGRMLKLEERVQAVKSKLPPPGTSQASSPRDNESGTSMLPPTTTVRRSSKRPSDLGLSENSMNPNLNSVPETPVYRPSSRLSYSPRLLHNQSLDTGNPQASMLSLAKTDAPRNPGSAATRPGSRLSRPSVSRLIEPEVAESVDSLGKVTEQKVSSRRTTYGRVNSSARQSLSVTSAIKRPEVKGADE